MTNFVTSKIIAPSAAFAVLSFLVCGQAFAQDATATDSTVVEAQKTVVLDENGNPIAAEVEAVEEPAVEENN